MALLVVAEVARPVLVGAVTGIQLGVVAKLMVGLGGTQVTQRTLVVLLVGREVPLEEVSGTQRVLAEVVKWKVCAVVTLVGARLLAVESVSPLWVRTLVLVDLEPAEGPLAVGVNVAQGLLVSVVACMVVHISVGTVTTQALRTAAVAAVLGAQLATVVVVGTGPVLVVVAGCMWRAYRSMQLPLI